MVLQRGDGGGDDADVVVLGRQAMDGAEMRADSLFRIASAGKPITAAATLALVADGRLGLDDPVAGLLPELAAPSVLREPAGRLDDVVPATRAITVADLLRSTNGHGFPPDFAAPVTARLMEDLNQGPPRPQEFPPADEWMAALGRVPLVHQPGDGFTYNTAFDILGVLIARASGMGFADYVAERILRPLGMDDTGFSYPSTARDRVTTLYRRDDGGRLEAVDGADGQWSRPPVFASGAGGWVSTAPDLLAFFRMLVGHGGDVLPADLVAAMLSDQLTPEVRATNPTFLDGQSWGYGGGVDIAMRHPWNVPGRYGWVGGTGTSAYCVPSDGSIAIVLTAVAVNAPSDTATLETFWAAAAEQVGRR